MQPAAAASAACLCALGDVCLTLPAVCCRWCEAAGAADKVSRILLLLLLLLLILLLLLAFVLLLLLLLLLLALHAGVGHTGTQQAAAGCGGQQCW